MKKSIYIAIAAVLIIISAILIETTQAKYRYQNEQKISVSSTPFYFTHSGQTAIVPYNSNTANVNISLANFVLPNYTEENIEYKVSISNQNYTFKVDNESAIEGVVTKSILGGSQNTESINVQFVRNSTTNIPDTEDITIQIETTYPYTVTKSYTVTICKYSFTVTGNPITWINTDVTLTVSPISGITLTEYSFDNGSTWVTTPNKTYTENTSNIKILAKDSFGQISNYSDINITYIDKTNPNIVINATPIIGTLNESKSILDSINITDSQSGINSSLTKVKYNGTEITNITDFSAVGRYNVTIEATDNAGNVSTQSAQVLVRWPTGGKYVLARQTVSTSADGLFADDASTGVDATLPYTSKYYYRGNNVDNYISFSGAIWRIVCIPQNDTVKMLTKESSSSNYHIENTYTNDWNDGDLRANFNTWAQNNYIDSHSMSVNFTGSDSHVEQGIFYIGAVERIFAGTDALTTVINDERTNTSRTANAAYQSYIGLITVSEYIKACNSSNVFNIRTTQTNKSDIRNSDWIYRNSNDWTMTAVKGTTAQYWSMHPDQLLSYLATSSYKIRPTIFLKADTILSGTGTSGDPFVVQENWDWFDNSV